MLVSNLQQFIRLLIPPLTASGINQSSANQVSKQLDALADALNPVQEMDIERLCELVQIVEKYRGQEIPESAFSQKTPARRQAASRAAKAPKLSVDEAVEMLQGLQQRARSMDPDAIEAEVKSLNVMTAGDLKQVVEKFVGACRG